MDMSPLRPQNHLYGCELKANKDYHSKVDNNENEHQLSLRIVSSGAGAKDELYTAEAEAMNYEGSSIEVTLATMSVQPKVSLGGFEITPPIVLRLKCGSGPTHISGQHLVAVEEDAELKEEEEEDIKLLSISGKRPAPGGDSKVPQKQVELTADEDDEDNEDEDDDDDNDDDDDFDEETEEKAPVKKGQESFKKQEKTPKTPKGPSSVENINTKM
ncbi:nucleophosmin-like [Octodon degus]|uniref:Nucleophosmin n=1 Tax=Octodon degus TaxID=10160 RepID=A0A6P6ELW8_OCTDE|nr:nucleophosmin-like [Octodon degus]